MQTFLPYESFVRSAEVLDSPRLGKQRVETLQMLRALVLPSYGWQTHPAVLMWRGHVPALTRYGLDMAEAWTGRGHADTTARQLLEFAPEVGGQSQADLGDAGHLPSWLGRDDIHLSHRSNLVRKAPQVYGPLFPGVAGDLPYVWPGPDAAAPSGPEARKAETRAAETVWIVRARDEEEALAWRSSGSVRLSVVSPRGKLSPKWRRQVDDFSGSLRPGCRVALLFGAGVALPAGIVTGDAREVDGGDGAPSLARSVDFDGELLRGDVTYPALLQDPRFLFPVPVRVLVRPPSDCQ